MWLAVRIVERYGQSISGTWGEDWVSELVSAYFEFVQEVFDAFLVASEVLGSCHSCDLSHGKYLRLVDVLKRLVEVGLILLNFLQECRWELRHLGTSDARPSLRILWWGRRSLQLQPKYS